MPGRDLVGDDVEPLGDQAILDRARLLDPAGSGSATLLLGYARIPIPAIPTAVKDLAEAIRPARES